MHDNERRWIHATWCDDIRHEVGNKTSLMGIYSSDLVVPALPSVLHKLCVDIKLSTPRTRPFIALKLIIRVNDSFEPLAMIDIPSESSNKQTPEELISYAEHVDEPKEAPRSIGFGVHIQIGPVPLSERAKWFQVIADFDGEIFESSKLCIYTPKHYLTARSPE